LRIRDKLWLAALGGILATFIGGALVLPQSFRLAALCDITQALLLASGTAAFVPLAIRSQGRLRLFWSLIALGIGQWTSYQLIWVCYEVVLRRDVPDLFAGDIILFLDIVPLMAALALRPHAPQDEYTAQLGRLDFVLMLVWWLYLYVLLVVPWQYGVANTMAYNRNLDGLFLAEKVAFLAGLAICWFCSAGDWRNFYASFFGMALTYSVSSSIANHAITRNVYYSGSLYDIPISLSMAWLTWIGLRAQPQEAAEGSEVSRVYGVWMARVSMIAMFSLPVLAAWSLLDSVIPLRIREFRLALTLSAALVMGIMVFIRQYWMDRELLHLLNHSRESFQSLKRLQAQVLQSEKLASIGQLVGGAAHELNNPITAMLGYSDLLLSTSLTSQQQPLAAKIGQCARRTKTLVASLLSFARQTPAPKTAIDLNTMARTAVKLTQSHWEPLHIEVRMELDPQLAKVSGASNQLLQVCLQVIGNCLHVMSEKGGKVLTIRTSRQENTSLLQIATESIVPAASCAPVSAGSDFAIPSASDDLQDGLALSACQGIVQEHHGSISSVTTSDGAILLRIELPAIEAPGATQGDPAIAALWQPRPSA
jgi:signal transduction histidine kinase